MLSEILIMIIGIAVLILLIIIVMHSAPGTRKVKALIAVFLLLWAARFIVDRTDTELGVIEVLMNSMLHTFQSFSMDADYTQYTLEGKDLLENSGNHILSVSYGIIISALNVLAPVLGGVFLLDILTAFFPIIWLHIHPFCHKFVFSEMNEDAVTLAEDIVRNREKKYRRILSEKYRCRSPLIIFTDAYKDNESENMSELFGRAKSLGAVCIKNDMLHLPLVRSKSIDYFLIDLEPSRNLSILAALLNNTNTKKEKLWPICNENGDSEPCVRIFTFLKDEAECEIATTVYRKSSNYKNVTVRNIRDYRNTVINLLHDVPLFLPLLKEKKNTLTVTILGSGHIGEEALKNVFWCGQMINTRLHINVISNHVKPFEKIIKNKCPELLESCCYGSELLQFSEKGEINQPYCEIKFIDIDDVRLLSDLPDDVIKKTDYYVIALGKDDLNLEVTNLLKQRIMKEGLRNNTGKNPVIALALYSKDLADAVRVINPESDTEAPAQAPYIIPFATREDRFSCKNVFMSEVIESAKASANLYTRNNAEKESADEYSYWANLAKTVHVPYKLYGIGAVEKISYEPSEGVQIQYKKEDYRKKEKELSWIEHRRWNAFLRAQGFASPTPKQYENYYANHLKQIINKSIDEQKKWIEMHKSIDLKLHSCLVESSIESILFDSNSKDNLDKVTEESFTKEKNALKELQKIEGAERINELKKKITKNEKEKDYKRWDAYQKDFALAQIIYEQAIKYYEKADSLPKDDKLEKVAVILSEQLVLYANSKLWEEAEKKYDEIMAYDDKYRSSIEVKKNIKAYQGMKEDKKS